MLYRLVLTPKDSKGLSKELVSLVFGRLAVGVF